MSELHERQNRTMEKIPDRESDFDGKTQRAAPLVDADLRELFIDAVSLASDCYLREEFERAGITSDELPLPLSPSGRPMETMPVFYRVSRYFASVDWCDRSAVGAVLPIVNRALSRLSHHPSGLLGRIETRLQAQGLSFRDGKIRRSHP